jgi:nitrogen regulatory protein P-II 2
LKALIMQTPVPTPMAKHPKKLLVIITEAALEKRLIQDAKRLGAHGYTVYDVRGGSEHATHEGAWEADRMIEIKIICDDSVANTIAQHVMAQYADHYGVSLFFADVAVIRPQKF